MDKILINPHERLRKKSEPLTDLSEPVLERLHKLFDLTYQSDGVGLAAPQVGWNVRAFVINATGSKKDELVFINPVVITEDDEWEMMEGCLSIPGVAGLVDRKSKVKVKATNLKGEEFEVEADGFLGRVILHENDHLDGILFIDRAKKLYMGEQLDNL